MLKNACATAVSALLSSSMKQHDTQKYARELKRWLKTHNLSVNWIAERLGKSRGTIYNYMSQKEMPDAVCRAIDALRADYESSNIREIDTARPVDAQEYALDLKAWLKENRLSVDWLAERLGKSKGTIYNYLSGYDKISPALMRAISALRADFEKNHASTAATVVDGNSLKIVACIVTADDMDDIKAAAELDCMSLEDFAREAIMRETAAVLDKARRLSKDAR